MCISKRKLFQNILYKLVCTCKVELHCYCVVRRSQVNVLCKIDVSVLCNVVNNLLDFTDLSFYCILLTCYVYEMTWPHVKMTLAHCWLIVDDAGGRECDLWYWRVEVGMIRGVDTLDGDMTQAFTTYKYSIAGKHTQFQNILSFCSLEKQLTLYPSVLEVFFKSKKK